MKAAHDRRRRVLLVRGINVGGHRTLPMAELRQLLAGLGHTNVRTLLNSGNAVFDAGTGAGPDRLSAVIQAAIEQRFGYRPKCVVLTAEALEVIVAENTLAEVGDNPSRLMVAFLSGASERRRILPLAHQPWDRDALAVGTLAAYVWCPDSVLDSPAFAALGRVLGTDVTTRNWATTLKIQAACRAP